MATEAGTAPPDQPAPDGGAVVDEATSDTGTHHAHPTEGRYVQIALILAAITAVEVIVYYVDALQDVLVPILLTLSVVKFTMVVLFFMHLRFDSRLFRRLFVLGLALAMFVYGIVLTTFHFWTR